MAILSWAKRTRSARVQPLRRAAPRRRLRTSAHSWGSLPAQSATSWASLTRWLSLPWRVWWGKVLVWKAAMRWMRESSSGRDTELFTAENAEGAEAGGEDKKGSDFLT